MPSQAPPLWAAIQTVKRGLSARAGLGAFRSGGGSIRDATWFRLVAEARRSLGAILDEATRPLSRRPVAEEITTFSTRTATGYLQQVEVFVRDRTTGLVETRPHSIRTTTLLSRRQAVNEAVELFQNSIDDNPDIYDEQILGAAYVATFQLVPEP